MNKIIIVGHPQSGCQEVESLLHACGMKPPLPSKRDGFLPADIGATLCKAYKKQTLADITVEEDIGQIDVGSVWNGMALDLLLANLDQELWGWSDPQAIYLLDYWKALDPKVTFVLVYDEPHRVLAETAHDKGETLSPEELSHRLDNWSAYNGALLSFFLRNPGRCLLVNVQQVRRAASSYLKALQVRLDFPLARLEVDQQVTSDSTCDNAGAEDEGACSVCDTSSQTTKNDLAMQASRGMAVGALAPLTTPFPVPCLADGYLIDCVMAEHPDCLQRYEELQSVANLPLDRHGRRYHRPTDAWLVLVRKRASDSRVFDELLASGERVTQELQQQTEAFLKLLEDHATTNIELTTTKKKTEEQAAQLQKQIDTLKAQLAKQTDKEAEAPLEQHKELTQENELLLLQLHQVQEELERYYLENQQLKKNQAPAKAPKPVYYGAADRIKRQLSYRLGAVIVQRSNSLSGLLALPWALAREARDFRKEKAQRTPQKLPPIEQYQDAHQAEKVKRHLSYRLGTALVQHGGSPLGWLKMPFLFRREVKAFQQQRRGA